MKKNIILFIIIIFFISGCSVKKAEDVTDAEIFAAEYAISKDNVFKYADIEDILNIFRDGTGIIIFGNSDKYYSLNFVQKFSELIDTTGIKEVLYYNPQVIRDNEALQYDELMYLIDSKIFCDEDVCNLIIPSIYFIIDGKVIGYNDSADQITDVNDDDFSKFDKELEDSLSSLIAKYCSELNL